MGESLSRLLLDFDKRVLGTRIRGQVVKNTSLTLEPTVKDGELQLRCILVVFFNEPELPEHMSETKKLLARMFWDVNEATAVLWEPEIYDVLSGRTELPSDRWKLEDEYGDVT